MKKIAIVGVGKNFKKILNSILDTDNISIVGICETGMPKVKAKINEHIIYTDNYKDLVSFPDLTIFDTTEFLNYTVVREFVERKTDIVLQKPVALNYSDFNKYIKLAKSYGVNLYSMLDYSHGKEISWFKENMQKDVLPDKITAICANDYYNNGVLSKEGLDSYGAYMESTIDLLSAILKLYDGELVQKSLKRRFDCSSGLDIWANSSYELILDDKIIPIDITASWETNRTASSISLYYPDQVYVLDGHNQLVKTLQKSRILYRADGDKLTNRYIDLMGDIINNKDNSKLTYKINKVVLQGLENEKQNIIEK